jgi:hypothetical protein
MKATTLKEALIATRWILQHTGWCQGQYYMNKEGHSTMNPLYGSLGGCCLGGARDLVECDRAALRSKLFGKILGAIKNVDNNCYTVVDWNDHPERTKEEVFALLDKLIEEQE